MTEQPKAQQIVIKNARVRYAKLIKPGQAFDEGQPDLWSVNIYPTDQDAAKLNAAGCVAKEDKQGGWYYSAKRNVINKKREDVPPPPLVDAKKNPFNFELGNGSVCNIAATPFAWTKGNKSGVLLYLNAVQVVEYIAMSSGVDAFDVVEGAEMTALDAAAETAKPRNAPVGIGEDDDGLPF